MYRWIISLGNLILFINIKMFHCDKTKNKDFVLHCCPWFDLKWVGYVSKLWSKCLPFRACLWAFLSAFYWRFCLVGLSVYSYPGLEAHVCDGLSGWKKYVTCVKTLLLTGYSYKWFGFESLGYVWLLWWISINRFWHLNQHPVKRE